MSLSKYLLIVFGVHASLWMQNLLIVQDTGKMRSYR